MAESTTEQMRATWVEGMVEAGAKRGGISYDALVAEFDRWLADHDEQVRAEERERIAMAIEASPRWFTFEDDDVEPDEPFVSRIDAARIARQGATDV